MRRLSTLVLLGLLAGGCGGMDAAAMVDPGTSPVTADVGDLRVLRHRDDPTVGDRWIDVLHADPTVFERTGSFREEGSRTAEDDEPADVRLLYEAVAPGRTLVVRMDCRGCGSDGVPDTPPADTQLLLWELVAGEGGELGLGTSALQTGEVADVEVGDHVVVVRPVSDERELRSHDGEVARLVASGTSDGLRVDVFAAVGPGRSSIGHGGAPDGSYGLRVGA